MAQGLRANFDREPDDRTIAAIRPVSTREAYALLVFPLTLLAVLLILSVTMGVSPPG